MEVVFKFTNADLSFTFRARSGRISFESNQRLKACSVRVFFLTRNIQKCVIFFTVFYATLR